MRGPVTVAERGLLIRRPRFQRFRYEDSILRIFAPISAIVLVVFPHPGYLSLGMTRPAVGQPAPSFARIVIVAGGWMLLFQRCSEAEYISLLYSASAEKQKASLMGPGITGGSLSPSPVRRRAQLKAELQDSTSLRVGRCSPIWKIGSPPDPQEHLFKRRVVRLDARLRHRLPQRRDRLLNGRWASLGSSGRRRPMLTDGESRWIGIGKRSGR